jgi:hypothetical protein
VNNYRLDRNLPAENRNHEARFFSGNQPSEHLSVRRRGKRVAAAMYRYAVSLVRDASSNDKLGQFRCEE